jgi:hypothetical protein
MASVSKGVPAREFQSVVTDQAPRGDEERVRVALEAALTRLLTESNQTAAAVLTQVEAEFSALLLGKHLQDPGSAQLVRVIRDVLAEARHRLNDLDHFTA